MGHRGMRATGGTRDAGGEAFGSGHLKRCLGSRVDLPSCAPPGAFGTPGLRKEVSLREAAAGGVGGAGGGEIFFFPRVRMFGLLPGTHRLLYGPVRSRPDRTGHDWVGRDLTLTMGRIRVFGRERRLSGRRVRTAGYAPRCRGAPRCVGPEP